MVNFDLKIIFLVITHIKGESYIMNYRKTGIILIICILSITVLCTGNPAITNTFSDIDLEMSIRKQLDKMNGRLTQNDLNKVEELVLDKYVTDLRGIEKLKNLKKLKSNCYPSSGDTLIKDISPLSTLSNLEELHLPYCRISDLNPIKDLDNLKFINFDANLIEDAGPIASLDNIVNIVLDNNTITDLTPFSNLYSLRALLINNNEISDLTVISEMDNIEILGIAINKISDLYPLVNLTNLSTLMIYQNQFTDISPLIEIYNNGGFRKIGSIILLGEINPDLYNDYYPIIEALLKAGVNVIYDLGRNH